MKVFNISKNSVLTENLLVADTIFEKSKGLIGKSESTSLFFKTHWGIHTFSIRFPIDCIVCDNNFEIKTLREKIPPNRLFFWRPKYKNIFELPAGSIERTRTEIGDRLNLI